MKDYFGRDVKVGDYVTFATTTARNAGLHFGRIYKEHKSGNLGVYTRRHGAAPSKTTLKFPDRIVIINPFEIPESFMEPFDSLKLEE